MNFIKMIELLKDQIDYSTYNVLYVDFIKNFQAEEKNFRYTESTAKKTIERYIKKASFKDEKQSGLYSDGKTVLLVGNSNEGYEEKIKNVDLSKQVIEMLKDRKPVYCDLIDSITFYKTLNSQKIDDYLIKIEENFYNAKIIKEMVECVATKKQKYINVDLCRNGALHIQQKNSAFILPVLCESVPAYKNVNFHDFLKYCRDIEKKLFEKETKTA